MNEIKINLGNKKDYETMFCKCGCGNGVIIKADNTDKDLGVLLQLVSDNYYNNGNSRIMTLKEKLKRIWYIITNKEYCYFDILVNENELKEFKDFVSKI